MKKNLLLLFIAACLFSSCSKKDNFDPDKQAITDDAAIQTYLTAHPEIHATKDASGLYYQVITQGTGDQPTAASKVKVNYTGKLLNGTQFDSGTGFVTPLGGVIKGWQIGVPFLKSGGDSLILLIVPSSLGYANKANGAIPANSVLIFTITLIDAHAS